MHKATIVKVDNIILVDDEAKEVDCSTLPAYARVVQWNEDRKEGWIEFINDGFGIYLPNVKIVDFTPFQYLIDAWTVTPTQEERRKQREVELRAEAERRSREDQQDALDTEAERLALERSDQP